MAIPRPRLSELNGELSHNLVAYKWNVKLFPNLGGTNDTPPLAGIFLFRYTVFPEGSQEAEVLPLKSYEIQNFQNTTSMIHSILQQFPDLRSYVNLEFFSLSMAIQLACKFHFRPEFFKRKDHEHALILFLDLKVNRRMESKSGDNGRLKIRNYAEEYLKRCPKIKIRAGEPKTMEEIEHAFQLIKLDRIKEIGHMKMREDEVCPICLGGMYDGICSRTCCGHMFHASCIQKWLVRSNVSSCPVCRFSFYVNI